LTETAVMRSSGNLASGGVPGLPSSQSFRERLPRPEVGGLVTCVWVQQISTGAPLYEHRTVPNGSVEISCVLGTGLIRVGGPKRTPAMQPLAPGETVVGLRLRPGVAPAVLGLPASELVDVDAELDRLWGRSAVTLGERLAEAASTEDAARLLEHELVTRSAGAPEPDSLIAEAVKRLQPWQATSVSQLTSELFISPRQMRRRFLAAVGYGPKALQRILRFQGFLALSDARHADDMTLARLALMAGYADQAHLTRECFRLSRLTPSAFLEETRRSCGPSHDHGPSLGRLRRALVSAHGPTVAPQG
jgi:AraC-like DNA-binding protein